VRVLLASTGLGLLVLAGSAAAGQPSAHTLRKSATGPIEAVAQDGNLAAWFTFSNPQGPCDEVHVLSPGRRDRSLPQPSSGSMTCGWNLEDGQPQLAIAGRMSTAIWTLHEGGPAPFDNVLAASIGGPERQLHRFAHATDGTGDWLGGVTGAGRTLAYSWLDVEYVDKLACLSGGSCQKKIADGGIRIVSRTTDTPLPGAAPALGLAAAAGRIAYIPATIVKANHPSASNNTSVSVVDGASGDLVSQASVRGIPVAIALSPQVLAVLSQSGGGRARGPHDRISWFSAIDGTKLGSVSISLQAALQIAVSNRLVIYRVGRLLRSVATRNGHIRTLTKTAPNAVGLSLAHGRLVWAVNKGDTGRLRALAVG
jgi:hypothetical protein